jgi:hypothetical protein
MTKFLLVATVDQVQNVYTLIDLKTGERVPVQVVEKDWRPFRDDNPEGTYQSLLQARSDLEPFAFLPAVRDALELVEEEILWIEDIMAEH